MARARRRIPPGPTAPVCPTTPHGIPVRLLVDAEPRSRARRALPLFLLVALAAGIAAVALAGCGVSAVPRPPGAVVNRVQDDVTRPATPAGRVEAGRPRAALRVPPFALHVAALLERDE